MGLKPWEFWELTWNDYERLCRGYHHKIEQNWTHTRWVGSLIYNANSKKPKTPQQLVPLQLDKVNSQGPKIDVKALQEFMQQEQLKLNQKNGK